MKRTSIFLDELTLNRLRRAAQKQGVSSATLVREAVVSYLDAPVGTKGLPTIAGKFSSGRKDTSAKVDELLWKKPHG